jgi:hypothetical protein
MRFHLLGITKALLLPIKLCDGTQKIIFKTGGLRARCGHGMPSTDKLGSTFLIHFTIFFTTSYKSAFRWFPL